MKDSRSMHRWIWHHRLTSKFELVAVCAIMVSTALVAYANDELHHPVAIAESGYVNHSNLCSAGGARN